MADATGARGRPAGAGRGSWPLKASLIGAALAITAPTFALSPPKEAVVPTEPRVAVAAGDRQISPGAPAHSNRLAGESSPYLLQHADNPVNWFAWGPEALAAARERGVPVFLSIGYATCYWCHVMERESFEDDATAAYLNEHFVAIKVDREERPDIDDVYMTATQLMTGGGGWPMSVFLTPPGAHGTDDPGLKPFYAGTYFPKAPQPGVPSFMQALEGVSLAWRDRKADIEQQAERVASAVRERLDARDGPTRLGPAQIQQALDVLLRIHDDAQGGFGQAPKFPQAVYLELLLDERERLARKADQSAEHEARLRDIDRALDATLRAMALGGIFDQVGGGFHRYSTDNTWTIPHFEKMLYDQAQLLHVYTRRFAQTGEALYGRVAQQTAAYVLREMTGAEGGFFAAQDAEVDGHEGRNYLWTMEQMRGALSAADADLAIRVFGLDAGPNFRDPHHPEDEPASALRLAQPPGELAERLGLSEDALFDRLDAVRARLLEARLRRDQPRTDDKAIAEWTGMMIAALADASRPLNEPKLLEAAQRAGEFVWTRMRDDSGGLARTSREGRLGPPGGLADYAQMARGFAAIARASADSGASRLWLERAQATLGQAQRRFDADDGGWFDVEGARPDLFVRPRTTYDGATPSGSAAMLHALLDLFEIGAVSPLQERLDGGAGVASAHGSAETGETPVPPMEKDRRPLERAEAGLRAVSATLAQAPAATAESARALGRLLDADATAAQRFAALPEPRRSEPGDVADDLLHKARDAVRIFADRDAVIVARGEPATITIELRIADGFHITAHDPGVEGLFGAAVRVAGGAGVRAVAHYPEGRALEVVVEGAETAGSPRVYTGVVRIEVELVRTDEAPTGRPRLEVAYQVCTDRVCLAPVSARLGVQIEAK